jgi:thiamine biosynthesis lipoprotein
VETETKVSFGITGMEIDLGGIAKGYTSSRVMDIFREHGVKHGLVSLGGNVQAIGTKKNGKPWRVAIQNPESEMEYLGVLNIEDKCVITSGGYERFFEKDGVHYHHIIDPRTGYPADSGLISATIISEDGALADGLSTSLFIMGKDEAEKYWREHADDFDYILEDEDGTLYVTEGADEILTTDNRTIVIRK